MKILKMVIKLLSRYENKRKVEEKKYIYFFFGHSNNLGKKRIGDNSLPDL